MKTKGFLDRMAEGWTPKKSKKKDQNWFFQDIDLDGVMNGVDCKPYDRKRQDSFLAVNTGSKYFKMPAQGQSFSPRAPVQQTVVLAQPPQPKLTISQAPTPKFEKLTIAKPTINIVPVPYDPRIVKVDSHGNLYKIENNVAKDLQGNKVNINYTPKTNMVSHIYDQNTVNSGNIPKPYKNEISMADNNVPFISQAWLSGAKFISPEGKEYKSKWDGQGGVNLYDSNIRREFMGAADLGINQDNLLALQKVRRPLYIQDNVSPSIVTDKAVEYIADKGIKFRTVDINSEVLNTSSDIIGQKNRAGGMYVPSNNEIIIGKYGEEFQNQIIRHEVGHAINAEPSSNMNILISGKPNVYKNLDPLAYDLYDQNKFNNPIRDSNLYIPTRASGKEAIANEAKSYYLDEYYKGSVQRNPIVDAFEDRLQVPQAERPRMSIKEVVMAGNAAAEGVKILRDKNSLK